MFDRALLKKYRDRVGVKFLNHDFLIKNIADDLFDRINLLRNEYKNILYINALNYNLYDLIQKKYLDSSVTLTNMSQTLVHHIFPICSNLNLLIQDEENLQLESNSIDLMISFLSIHGINDVMSHLKKLHHILKPGGGVMFVFFGGRTLSELRHALAVTDAQYDMATARVSPFIDVKTFGMLLQKIGLQSIVSDSNTITIEYEKVEDLLYDIKYQGNSGVLTKHSNKFMHKNYFNNFIENYKLLYTNQVGKYLVTVDIINAIGFK